MFILYKYNNALCLGDFKMNYKLGKAVVKIM